MGSSGDKQSLLSLTNHEIYVTTCRDGTRRSGMVITWLTPATLVPDRPRIIVALSHCNYTTELIAKTGHFLAQLLSTTQVDLVPRFGLHSGRDTDKFKGLSWGEGPGGLPLLEDTCGYMHAAIINETNLGDRVVYIADIIEQEVYPGRIPLRVNEAFAALPTDQAAALAEKRKQDGERDRGMITNLKG